MGCFTGLKSKKKKSEQTIHIKRVPKEQKPTTLPEPKTRSLQSAPPSFRNRVKPIQPANRVVSNRARALSAPSTLDAADQDDLSEYEEPEDSKYRSGTVKEQLSPVPQPLPLPSPQVAAALRTTGSFKSVTNSGSLYASGPLPLPPTAALPTGTLPAS
ncbi:hypothetical protein C1H46_036132 [Malus baccata]|uniref:Uncharacterized protein n=1 Tax=Malus baccata TaxID=106549 RepID=A0A540KVT5_MALBA|nr:hypothetical protein C1H46_036132 [Malus baccata]